MSASALTISRILHAGYVFECEGTRIAFDTIFENPFSRNCHAFPDVRFDRETDPQAALRRRLHLALPRRPLLAREPRPARPRTPLYIYCIFDELFDMVRQLGFANVQPLR
jgi:hypothetical protein